MWTLLLCLLLKSRITSAEFWGNSPTFGKLSIQEVEHDPGKLTSTITPIVNGSVFTVPPAVDTPDFRLPEPPWTAVTDDFYWEENRPYRASPFYKQYLKFNRRLHYEYLYSMGCICTTVFKRLTPLAGCAVITTRHALTTATSTELVLRRYRKWNTLENILGLWYDTSKDLMNSSMYATPARIHYHPRYQLPDFTNRSHPLPCLHDLAVWAMTYRFQGTGGSPHAVLCKRGVSNWWVYEPATPRWWDMLHIIGYQFVWAINRRPAPWYKYLVRTRIGFEDRHRTICPKTEWGWFFCVGGDKYSKLGMDSGGALHVTYEYKSWRDDGLIGLNAFSMRLRSLQLINYFTVLDTHQNVEFLYSSYMGRLPYQYLDYRFYNTQWRAPRVKPWHYVKWDYTEGWQPHGSKIFFN